VNLLEISKTKLTEFGPLVSELHWHLSSLAVVQGNNPGRVFAARVEDPQAVFIISPEGCYLAGDPSSDDFITKLKEYICDVFMKDRDNFELIFLPKWQASVGRAFGKITLESYKRYHYVITKKQFAKLAEIGEHENLPIPVHSSFVRNNLDMQNMKHVNNWILNNWGNYDNFEKKGFGRYILSETKVMSWSICDCVSVDHCEIGIWTDPAQRLQGNATAVVQAMLIHAFDNGFSEVGWHCSWDNKGSYKTAEKCGFRREREYLAYYPAIVK
jgi:RimJ/RimL family protein N-acetyltransferase